MADANRRFVSRGGDKLAAALDHFSIEVGGLICADLGSHVGGFVDCLLQRGAARVYSVDTAYGLLAWKLRKDPRVVVLERSNALHVRLPEAVEFVSIDLGWTKQAAILPHVASTFSASTILTLIKPHYEAGPEHVVDGVLPSAVAEEVVASVLTRLPPNGWTVTAHMESPLRGHAGNREWLAWLKRI